MGGLEQKGLIKKQCHLYKLQITCPAILGLKTPCVTTLLEWCRTRWFSHYLFPYLLWGENLCRSILVWQILALEFGKCITSEALDFVDIHIQFQDTEARDGWIFFGVGVHFRLHGLKAFLIKVHSVYQT